VAASLSELGGPERRLVITCARLELEQDRRAEVEALLEEHLDWCQIVQHARLHSVAPLLHHHLRDVPAGRIPDHARADLLRLHHRAAFQTRLYERENAALLEAFRDASIPTLVPKGISIVEHVYGDLGLRPLIDLMFLVPPEKVTDVKKVLVARGYLRDRPRPIHGLYRWSCPELIYKRGGAMHFAVLVVWDLVSWPRLHGFDTRHVWPRARQATVSGQPTLILSPEDLVLYLCQMADNHGHFNRVAGEELGPADLLFTDWTNNRLVRFTDLHEVIRCNAGETRWELLVQRARESHLNGAAWASLRLAATLLGTEIDASVLEELLPDGKPSSLRRRVFASLVASESREHGLSRCARIGRWWRSRRPYTQILLGRLLGWIEISFPDLDALRRVYGLRSRPAAWAPYAAHAGRSLLRSPASYVGLRVLRALGHGAAPASSWNPSPETLEERPSR
jgi:hypothetical protein